MLVHTENQCNLHEHDSREVYKENDWVSIWISFADSEVQ